jgi:hypothetical protein
MNTLYIEPNGSSGSTVTTVTEELSLQAKLEQIEAAIVTAHGHVAEIVEAPTDENPSPDATGADAAAHRCIDGLAVLNERLARLSQRIGTL